MTKGYTNAEKLTTGKGSMRIFGKQVIDPIEIYLSISGCMIHYKMCTDNIL
jgi:hypothetical protein